mmetsp:Transcript_105845/g.210371  ORF Transcript_105845/g.210371 Transcript_105845/m.210371 type:complete len:309 (+) Transcript_105845:874-1800(+)
MPDEMTSWRLGTSSRRLRDLSLGMLPSRLCDCASASQTRPPQRASNAFLVRSSFSNLAPAIQHREKAAAPSLPMRFSSSHKHLRPGHAQTPRANSAAPASSMAFLPRSRLSSRGFALMQPANLIAPLSPMALFAKFSDLRLARDSAPHRGSCNPSASTLAPSSPMQFSSRHNTCKHELPLRPSARQATPGSPNMFLPKKSLISDDPAFKLSDSAAAATMPRASPCRERSVRTVLVWRLVAILDTASSSTAPSSKASLPRTDGLTNACTASSRFRWPTGPLRCAYATPRPASKSKAAAWTSPTSSRCLR